MNDHFILSRPGYKKRLPGQGMPLMKDPEKYGDLIIEFDVQYPRGLTSDQKLYIKEALINNKKQHQHQHRKKNLTDGQ
jgi:DnaJ-class molecular chaperone